MGLEQHKRESQAEGPTVFAYLVAEMAPLYRAIMRAFVISKKRFVLHLRLQDLLECLRISGFEEGLGEVEIDSALRKLCEWGNLQSSPDPVDVRTVDEFNKSPRLFQITHEGEAAEWALGLVEAASGACAEPQGTTVFADIVHVLGEMEQMSRGPELDPAKVHRNLVVHKARFEDLMVSAYALIGKLERSSGASVAEMRRLVDYAERFTGELVMAADRVGEAVRAIEHTGNERLFQAAAEHVVRDGLDGTPQTLAVACARWRAHWKLFCEWFTSQRGRLSNAELLRERIRAAIPALIQVITRINDRQLYRIDRSNDFRVLARWFAHAESDAEAHRLWRALFGLCSARHLIVNETTLDDYEASNARANTTWMDSPPLRISIRIRDGGSRWEPALSRIVDRTAEKEKLVAATREESLRILTAQTRLATGRRVRLSDFDCLQVGEFELFLDLLADAMSARVFPTELVEIVSGDGCLKVKLEPTGDGREALVVTPEGLFSGPDHWITVEQISTGEVLV